MLIQVLTQNNRGELPTQILCNCALNYIVVVLTLLHNNRVGKLTTIIM